MQRIIIGYCRVSTAIQVTDGCSLVAQAARIRRWAETQGHIVGGMYEDAGITGTRTDIRPGLRAALDAACAAKGILVCASLSRVSRSTRHTIDIATELERAGADLASLTESLDTSSAHGRFVLKLLASLAEMEAEVVAERTLASMSHLRSTGRLLSSRVPFGWDAVGDGYLAVNDREQAIIATLRQRRASGASWCSLATWLTTSGVPAKMGGTWRGDAVKQIVLRAERTDRERAA